MRALLVCVAACTSVCPDPAPIEPSPTVVPKPSPKRSAIPTVASPCDDERQTLPELVADFDHPTERPGAVLCWGNECVWDAGPVRRPSVHHFKIEHRLDNGTVVGTAPLATVHDGKVCTPDRCDALGPRLRAAVEGVDPDTVRATADREAVVIGDEVWSRATDRKLVLPPARSGEHEVDSILVLGNSLAIGRSCNEYCPLLGRMIDSRGRAGTERFVFGNPVASIPGPIDLAGDRFVLFDGFGEVTLIAHGKVVASRQLGQTNNEGAPKVARVIALPLTSEEIALEVCTTIGCQLALLQVREWAEPGTTRASPHLEHHVVRQLPLCTAF